MNDLADKVLKIAEDMKAKDIVVLDVSKYETCGRLWIVMTALAPSHISAIIREIKKSCARHFSTEGGAANSWVLIDAGDVIVHIFLEEARKFYDIERLWE